jgi:hypothetical protein
MDSLYNTLTTWMQGSDVTIGSESTKLREEITRLENNDPDFTTLSICGDLDSRKLFPTGSARIAKALPGNTSLTRLYFSSQAMPEEIITSLHFNRSLKTLSLEEGPRSTATNVRLLVANLAHISCLTLLSISSRELGPLETESLAMNLRNNSVLQALDLRHSRIGSGIKFLAEMFKRNHTISELVVSDNELEGAHFKYVEDMLSNNQGLQYLDLSKNYGLNSGMEALSNGLISNTSLTSLNLGFGNIGVEGLNHLIKVIENNRFLQELYLRRSCFGNVAAQMLGVALSRNTSLLVLDLSNTNFYSKAYYANALQYANAEGFPNSIGYIGGEHLAAALVNNYTIVSLNLDGNDKVDPETVKKINKLLFRNQRLRSVQGEKQSSQSTQAPPKMQRETDGYPETEGTTTTDGIDGFKLEITDFFEIGKTLRAAIEKCMRRSSAETTLSESRGHIRIQLYSDNSSLIKNHALRETVELVFEDRVTQESDDVDMIIVPLNLLTSEDADRFENEFLSIENRLLMEHIEDENDQGMVGLK